MGSIIELWNKIYEKNDSIKALTLTFAILGVACIISVFVYILNLENIEDNEVWECYEKLKYTELNNTEYDYLISHNCYQRRDYIDIYSKDINDTLYWFRCKDEWDGRCMFMEKFYDSGNLKTIDKDSEIEKECYKEKCLFMNIEAESLQEEIVVKLFIDQPYYFLDNFYINSSCGLVNANYFNNGTYDKESGDYYFEREICRTSQKDGNEKEVKNG